MSKILGVKNWSQEEQTYLEDKWGVISIKGIAKHLGKSINAVKLKAQRIGLQDPRFSFEGITVNQLAVALNKSYNSLQVWIGTYNMPVRKKVFCAESEVLIIDYNDFWKWAEQHKELINFTKMELNILGPEPDWVKIKRKADCLRSQKTWQSVDWTPGEDQRLVQMVRMSGVTYPQLSKHLNRSEASVKRRLYDLNVKFRPERLNNLIKYTPQEIEKLSLMARQGFSYETIAQALNKSALGIRGKLERMKFDFKRREFKQVGLS